MTTRWSITVIACWAFATIAPAQPARIDGVYNGSYAGGQDAPVRGQVANARVRPVNFKLSITQQDNGTLTGVFTLYLPEGSETKAYNCAMTGYVQANRTFLLKRGQWETSLPRGFELAGGMNGLFDPGGGNGAGQVSGKMRGGSWPKFEAIRDADETAKMASATTDTKQAGAPAMPVARSERRATAAQPAASPPASPAPVPGFTWRTAIWNGVYTGTYGTNADDNVTAKLYVKFIADGSVDGILDGLFTFEVPPSLGAKPVTYTYKLIGRPEVRMAVFYSAKPLGRPAPDAYAVTQLGVQFPTIFFKGINGQLESRNNPDQISGRVSGSNGLPRNNFVAVRDQAKSANVDSLMAAQASAGSAVSTTEPAQAPTVAPVVRPGTLPQGVFNGTYTRENEPPTRFKLTITRANDNLGGMAAGMATIYLPTGSGTKAYTYSLIGHYAERDFELKVNDWETIPPKDFKNFKAMGFNGRFLSNLNQNTARIISVQESRPNVASNVGTKNGPSKRPATDVTFFVPTFEAAWDPKESADIKGTLAAQKAVGDADQIADLQEHAETIKNAQPKQLASKDLVRKSPAYWDGYRSDFIREVFDGGFADDVDSDPAFQSLFIDYVDLFSNTCAAYLPAGHHPITITTTTTTTYPGGATTTSTTSKTVDIDPRFIDKYAEYSGVDPEPGSEQEKEQTAKTVSIVGYIFHRGGPSHGTSFADANALIHLAAARGLLGGSGMKRFFATEIKARGPSAALRQMGENLLRGATGEPSLQEAGGKIAGAAAETDPDLPPGRFAHLVDAAHAFYREPAHARLASRFQTAFDETLAAKYRGVMTREEEYYYANDFEGRFRGQIMQPRSYCKDPEWPRLHPAVEECIVELQ